VPALLPVAVFREIKTARCRKVPIPHDSESVRPTTNAGLRAVDRPLDRTIDPARDSSGKKASKIGCWMTAVVAIIVLEAVAFIAAAYVVSSIRGTNALERANELVEAEKFAAAIPLYTAALNERLDKQDRALAYGNRGWAYTNVDRDPEAIQDFNSPALTNPISRGHGFSRAAQILPIEMVEPHCAKHIWRSISHSETRPHSMAWRLPSRKSAISSRRKNWNPRRWRNCQSQPPTESGWSCGWRPSSREKPYRDHP
jgi:hypothetical protein